jgi:hypothetical protein
MSLIDKPCRTSKKTLGRRSGGTEPASNSKAWAELSANEKAAAGLFGYRPNTWDADICAKR